jgi:hypothetical protein
LGPYPVSGKVLDKSGAPVAGVKIRFSSRTGTVRIPLPVTTAADGSWSQEGFGRARWFQATPVLRGWRFTPEQREYSQPTSELNFEGEGPFSVVGKVIDRTGRGVEGVKIVFSSGERGAIVPEAVVTDASGSFSQEGFWARFTYTARPYKEGWGFAPASQDFDISSTILAFTAREPYSVSGRITDRSGKGVGDFVVTFSASGAGDALFAVVRTASDGTFSQSGFCGGTTYRALPQHEDWTFIPAFREFEDASDQVNFEAREPEVVITVSSDYGSPIPPCGENVFIRGSSVDASVNAIVSEEPARVGPGRDQCPHPAVTVGCPLSLRKTRPSRGCGKRNTGCRSRLLLREAAR